MPVKSFSVRGPPPIPRSFSHPQDFMWPHLIAVPRIAFDTPQSHLHSHKAPLCFLPDFGAIYSKATSFPNRLPVMSSGFAGIKNSKKFKDVTIIFHFMIGLLAVVMQELES